MNQFQEYPKKMSHPQHAPAIWKKLEGKGTGLFTPDTVCTQVERFAEVTVINIDQEKQYASKGYRPNNMPDPAGYEQAILDTQPTPGHKFQAYPKWKYHAIEIPVIVQNALEEKALGPEWADAPIIATEDDLPVLAGAVSASGGAVGKQLDTTITTTKDAAGVKAKAKPKAKKPGKSSGAHKQPQKAGAAV